jgi:hypothetical protein
MQLAGASCRGADFARTVEGGNGDLLGQGTQRLGVITQQDASRTVQAPLSNCISVTFVWRSDCFQEKGNAHLHHGEEKI